MNSVVIFIYAFTYTCWKYCSKYYRDSISTNY